MTLDMKRRLLSFVLAAAMLASVVQPTIHAAVPNRFAPAAGTSSTETIPPEDSVEPQASAAADEVATPGEIVLPAAPQDPQTPAAEESAEESAPESTEESAPETPSPYALYEDAVAVGTWTGNQFGEVQVENGWLHMKSTHGDNGTQQFYVQNPDVRFDQSEGYLEFIVKPANAAAKTRFGVYLRSSAPQDGFFVGYDASGWFWQIGANWYGQYGETRLPAPGAGEEVKVRIEYTETQATVTVNGQDAFNGPVDLAAAPSSKGGSLAFKCGSYGSDLTDVRVRGIHYEGQKEIASYQISGLVTEDGAPAVGASVKIGSQTVTTDADGRFLFTDIVDGTYTVTASKEGLKGQSKEVVVKGADVTDLELDLVSAAVQTIRSDAMEVSIYEDFPAVKHYTMTGGNLDGKRFYGQNNVQNVIRINGSNISLEPEDVSLSVEGSKAVYTLHVKDASGVDAVITTVLSVEGNVLTMEITDVAYTQENGKQEHPVQTILFPEHSLVSVRSSQANASFAASKMSSNTRISGDTFLTVDSNLPNGSTDYMYAFVSADGMSAAIESNSEYEGSHAASYISAGGASNTRIWANVSEIGNEKSMGLGSALFYWNRAIESKDESDPTGRTNRIYVTEPTENPLVKVIITGDENDNGTVDWQDGAIAFRRISHELLHSDEVPEAVSMRVCMNFSGQAANPFMQTLDNVKRVYLNTDGLGQAVLLKGYANEGHDSGHPDYADIGQRLGGAQDMNKLMIEGRKLGATFGIHVNASEMYTEAKAFDELLLRRNAQGNLSYGWNWLDQGIGIDSKFDLVSGRRANRFNALEELVGQNLGWVYVDVWGNLTSTLEDSWATRRLSDEITNNGWRMTTEWGPTNEYDSTFQHWATDLTYGGYKAKGYNSTIARFIRNHQKDSWVGDFTRYGGAANAPLLGGYDMKDFEGWQGRSNYDDYINNIFTNNLSTKFFQHFQVTEWVNAAPVSVVLPTFQSNGPQTETVVWSPEKKITLKHDTYGTVTVERKDAEHYSEAVLSDYRNRTVTLNGKTILTGCASRSDTNEKGNETYLLPWFWDANGVDLAAQDQKLYHWNTSGGTTTWELPNGWEDLTSVVVYTLSDTGKTNETVVPVVGGKVTLTADAEVPYVVYKGEKGQLDIGGWQGNHLYDTGFNTYSLKDSKWTVKSGSPEIKNTVTTNPMLVLGGGDCISHTITDLVPGEQYALYIGVDNRSSANAHMTVTSVNGSTLASNYTGLSIAPNFISSDPHSGNIPTEAGTGSNFQNMYVFFTADAATATLTLSRDAGEGMTYFDNMRCVANEGNPFTYDENGKVSLYTQDFEHNVQGIYPFVIGPVEGISDNRSHLSELHAPYTQGGWDVKKGNDVLEGSWSLKTNGLTRRNSLLYQTIPQNFRFEPGCTYKVSFDYQSGSEGIYAVVVGNGTGYDAANAMPLHYKADDNGVFETQRFETTITGDPNGQTWFGVMSTTAAPNTHGITGSAADFADYSNLMLDNIRIERVEDGQSITKEQLNQLIDSAADYTYQNKGCTAEEWKAFEVALGEAKAVSADENASQAEVKQAYIHLDAAKKAVDNSSGLAANDDRADLDRTQMSAQAGNPQPGEGPSFILDNNPNSIYHTHWSISKPEEHWIVLTLNQPETVNGLRYLPRPSGSNGKMTEGTIEVMVEGSNEWTPVTAKNGTGNLFTFSTGGWSKASFEPVEHVVKVRLKATQTIGDAPNKFFSAAEVRLTKPFAEDAPAADTSALQNAIQLAKTLDSTRYTSESWNAMQTELVKAEQVLADPNATAEQISSAARSLNNAIDALVMPVYKPQIEEMLAMYHSLDPNDYLSGWDALQAAADQLQKLLSDENATQSQANAVIQQFYEAVNGLVRKPEQQLLKEAIANAEKVLNASSEAAFTAESRKAALDALAAAQELLAQPDATQQQLDRAIQELKAAIAGLVPSDSKKALDASIQTLKSRLSELEENEYTTSSWKAAQDALSHALSVQADPSAAAENYNSAVEMINKALLGLTKRGNAAALEKFVEQASKLESKDYTPGTWKNFQNALQQAQNLLRSAADASQADLNAALDALLNAQNHLLRTANKDALNAALAQANALTESAYTAESWAVFAKAKAEAAAVAGNADASQAQVDSAYTALMKAIQGLAKSAAAPTPAQPNGTPPTGDPSSVGALFGLMLASSTAALAVLHKKRKLEK